MIGHLIRTRRTLLGASLLSIAIGVLPAASSAQPFGEHGARVAAAQAVNESAQLRQVAKHGMQREEQGQGNGTFRCPLTIQFTVSVARANVSFAVHTSSGVIYGRGTPSYTVEGATAHINGPLLVTHGTGRYAHASGSRLQLRATVNRHTWALALAATGTIKL